MISASLLKEGLRVKYVLNKSGLGGPVGHIGTLKLYNHFHGWFFESDIPFIGGHSADGKGRDKHCWVCYKPLEELELAGPKEKRKSGFSKFILDNGL